MVKSSQFGKIAKQAGRNKRAGRESFSDLLNYLAENLRAAWVFILKNLSEQAFLLGTSEYPSLNFDQILDPTLPFNFNVFYGWLLMQHRGKSCLVLPRRKGVYVPRR